MEPPFIKTSSYATGLYAKLQNNYATVIVSGYNTVQILMIFMDHVPIEVGVTI